MSTTEVEADEQLTTKSCDSPSSSSKSDVCADDVDEGF